MAKYGTIKGAYSATEGDKFAIIDYNGEKVFEVTHIDGSKDLYKQTGECVMKHIKHIRRSDGRR